MFVIFLLLAFPRPAHAYLDPGTGSYVIQIVLASLVGVAFGVKVFFRQIASFFGALFGKKEKPEPPNA